MYDFYLKQVANSCWIGSHSARAQLLRAFPLALPLALPLDSPLALPIALPLALPLDLPLVLSRPAHPNCHGLFLDPCRAWYVSTLFPPKKTRK